VARIDSSSGAFILDPAGEFGVAEVPMSCDEIAASDAGFLMRLEDFSSQLDSVLVKTSYTVVVPEPGSGLAAMATLLTLAALARASRPGRRRDPS
jgi:hypothetical protein